MCLKGRSSSFRYLEVERVELARIYITENKVIDDRNTQLIYKGQSRHVGSMTI
jgi:hypothetical protein